MTHTREEFSVIITDKDGVCKSTTSEGSFYLEHEEIYCILLKNKSGDPVKVSVFVNDSGIGVFRIEPKDELLLKRHKDLDRRLQFMALDSAEAKELKLEDKLKPKHNEVRVVFEPKKTVTAAQHIPQTGKALGVVVDSMVKDVADSPPADANRGTTVLAAEKSGQNFIDVDDFVTEQAFEFVVLLLCTPSNIGNIAVRPTDAT